MAPISFSQAPTEAPAYPPIQLNSDSGSVRLSQTTAQARSQKINYGLGTSVDEVYQNLLSGMEDNFRTKSALEIDAGRNQRFNEMLPKILQRSGGVLTPEDSATLKDELGKLKTPTDPMTVVEEYYAKKASQELAHSERFNRAVVDYPKNIKEILEVGDTALAKSQVAATIAENWEERAKQQSWMGWGVDVAKDVFSLGIYGQVKTRGVIKGSGFLDGGLKGDNLAAQRLILSQLPLSEFAKELKRATDAIGEDNPAEARNFARAMQGMSTRERELENAWTVFTAGTFPSIAAGKAVGAIGKGIAKSAAQANTEREIKNAVTDLIKAADAPGADEAAIKAGAGDLSSAAIARATKNIEASKEGMLAPTERMIESLQTVFRTEKTDMKANPGNYTTGLVDKIEAAFTRFENNLLDTVGGMARVNRLNTLKMTPELMKDVKDMVTREFNGYTILDIGDIRRDIPTNTTWVKVRIGEPTLGQWTEKETAENYAAHHGFKGATVEQQGMGWHIVTETPFRETDNITRKHIALTKETAPPANWIAQLAHWIRTPDDTLSPENILNRKVVAYTPSKVLELFKEEGKAIHDLAKGLVKVDPATGQPYTRPVRLSRFGTERQQRMEEFTRMLTATAKLESPVDGRPGYFFKDPAELEFWYRNNFGRSPDTVEVEAYYAFKRIMEGDRFLRNLAQYRNMSRLGTQEHRIVTYDKAGNKVFSDAFNGIKLSHLPRGDESILIVGKTVGTAKVIALGELQASRTYKKYLRDVESGKLTVTKLYAPEYFPLQAFNNIGDGVRPRYVLAPSIETSPLKFDQIPRRGGPHVEYDYDFYAKQANIRYDSATGLHWYDGDNTAFPMKYRKEGNDVVKHLNAIRQLIKDKDLVGAEVYARQHFHIPWKVIHADFKASFNSAGQKLAPRFSTDEPFYLVPKDRSIIQMDTGMAKRYEDPNTGTSKFRDGTIAGSDNAQNVVAMSQKRDSYDVFSLKNVGTTQNPVWESVHAEVVDPLVSMNRNLTKMTNSLFMDDYKMASIEQWLKDAEPFLKADPAEIRSAPYHYFYQNDLYRTGVDQVTLQGLKSNQWKIQQFLGRKGPVAAYVDSVQDRFNDWTFGKIGEGAMRVTFETARNLPDLARAAMFQLSMGIFSIPQIFVQSQGFTTVAAVAGFKYAAPSTSAAYYTWLTRFNKNPNIIKEIDRKMAGGLKLPGTARWKVGEFEESLKLLDSHGFGLVGNDYALLHGVLNPQIVESTGRRFFNAGSVFFTMAERNMRFIAWHTAYKEFRDTVKPFGKLTADDGLKILNRADFLNVNMSHASNSIFQHGAFAPMTQFFTYQMRLAEQFAGRRLGNTWQERAKIRAKMVAWYAGLYGAPTTVGLTGLPAIDFFKKAAVDNGYIVGENWYSTAFMEGIPSYLGGVATGKYYNVGDRYGLQGFTFTDLTGDKEWYETIGGASAARIGDFGASLHPYWNWAAQMWRDPEAAYTLNEKVVLDNIKAISSSGNNYARMITALSTGDWVTRRGGVLEKDVPVWDTLFRTVTGLQPQQSSDVHRKSEMLKERENLWNKGRKLAIEEWQAGLRIASEDTQIAQDHFNNALAILFAHSYPMEKLREFMSIANKGHETVIDSIDWQLMMNNVPDKKKSRYNEAYETIQKMKEERRK